MKRGRPPRGRPTGRGHRVARAAGKKQSRRNSAGRSASTARSGKPRAGAKRRAATGPRSGAAGKKSAKRASAKRTGAPLRSAGSRAGAPKRATRAATRRAAPARGRVAAVRTAGRVADVRAERAAPVAVTAFATQRSHASAREELLFEIARARATVKAAIQGLSAGNAGRPIATGKWSPLEIVLHLGERDRVRLEEFRRTLSGQPRTWAGISEAEQDAQNEQHLGPLRAFTWDSAVRRLDSLREQLLLRLHEVPALPDDVWQRGHAFADMLWGLPEHDRHHAEQIKRARLGEPLAVED